MDPDGIGGPGVDSEGYAIVVFPLPVVVDITKQYQTAVAETGGCEIVSLKAIIKYETNFFSKTESASLLKRLCAYAKDGLHDKGNMYGVDWISDRKTIQIGDEGVPVYKYTGSSATETIRFERYPTIKSIREIVYERTGVWCNFCLYNHYISSAKLGWHSDNERNMVPRSPIVSFSFGFRRRFRVRDTETHEIVFDDYLESGSILIMEEDCQALTEHCIEKLTKKETKALDENEENIRVNLTLRRMVALEE